MSIIVKQEPTKFHPVTIVIDDVRTLNLIRYALNTFEGANDRYSLAGHINCINDYSDADFVLNELDSLNKELYLLCRD